MGFCDLQSWWGGGGGEGADEASLPIINSLFEL